VYAELAQVPSNSYAYLVVVAAVVVELLLVHVDDVGAHVVEEVLTVCVHTYMTTVERDQRQKQQWRGRGQGALRKLDSKPSVTRCTPQALHERGWF
jgi:hypothetical protein